jgi:hypothetical protein
MKWEYYTPDDETEADVLKMDISIQADYDAAAEYIAECRFDDWEYPEEIEICLRPAVGEWKTFTVHAEMRPVFFARESMPVEDESELVESVRGILG